MKESEPPPAPPKVPASYRYQLVTPKGTVLARSPTRQAACQTAAAMHTRLFVRRASDDWELYDDKGTLVAIITPK